MNKEELIIAKLVKVMANQQKILTKLAQVAHDPNVLYFKDAARTSAVNTGFGATAVDVKPLEGNQGRAGAPIIEPGYIVSVFGCPKEDKVRQKFVDTFKREVATEKPNLVQNLSITFGD